ncbi:methionyl-tRNA formyltransferase [Roseibium salinum]|nr:methionyl-tRNA formyltransferase [Roseibium salinum]
MGTPEFFGADPDGDRRSGPRSCCLLFPAAASGRPRHGLEKNRPFMKPPRSFGIPVFTPKSLKGEEDQAQFAALNADVAVVVAYGLLLPRAILKAPVHGCLNLHASVLPRWRGAAPINRAIMAGDKETAVQVMRMEEGLDTGPVCMSETVPIGENMTAGELHDQLSGLGGDLMVRALAALSRGALMQQPQPEEGVTYATKLSKEETRIDWTQSSDEVHNHIRGLSPFPGAWCEMPLGGKPERVKILRSALAEGTAAPGTVISADAAPVIACGSGAVRLDLVQRAGRKPMSGADFPAGRLSF